MNKIFVQHNDIQHNDMQHNDMQHNDMQHNDTQHNNALPFMLNVIMVSVAFYL